MSSIQNRMHRFFREWILNPIRQAMTDKICQTASSKLESVDKNVVIELAQQRTGGLGADEEKCLAGNLGVSVEELNAKIEEFKREGCKLFS